MHDWPDRKIMDLLQIDAPIIQAPMAGASTPAMAMAVAAAGGLGSLPGAIVSLDRLRSDVLAVRESTAAPINVNFFCHTSPIPDAARDVAWQAMLAPYYAELGIESQTVEPAWSLAPFNERHVELIEEVAPQIVSFHFGLPDQRLLKRVKATGAKVLSSATTVAEAVWLEAHGCDAVIAQGLEAGGHRGSFLNTDVNTQLGTIALVPQVVDAVRVPVIAAGGISDARGITAALMLGASAVQIGTAYLFCPEANVAPTQRHTLASASGDQTVVTNLFTGRPGRAIANRLTRDLGPMSAQAPAFPRAGNALAKLRQHSEHTKSLDYVAVWAGQAMSLGRRVDAGTLTRQLAAETLAKLGC